MWGTVLLFSGPPLGGLILFKSKRHRLPDVIGQIYIHSLRLSFQARYQAGIGAQVDPVAG